MSPADKDVPPRSLTEKRLFTLRHLAERDASGAQVSKAARLAGLNTSVLGQREWADKPLAWLRQQGLAELTGRRLDEGREHRLTEAGRALLAVLGQPGRTP